MHEVETWDDDVDGDLVAVTAVRTTEYQRAVKKTQPVAAVIAALYVIIVRKLASYGRRLPDADK